MLRQIASYACGALLLFVGFALVNGNEAAGRQEPPAKSSQQPDENKQKKAAPSKEEVERTPKTTNKAPLRVGDEEGETTQSINTVADLSQDAKAATNSDVRELFEALSPPHDLLIQFSGSTIRVKTAPYFIPPGGPIPQSAKVEKLVSGKNNTEAIHLSTLNCKSLQGFEQTVLERVNTFLSKELDKKPAGDKERLSRLEMLQVAEKALVAGILYHRSAKAQGKRDEQMWGPIAKELEARLVDVQVKRLHVLTDAKEWNKAFELASTLVEAYASKQVGQAERRKVQVEITYLLLKQADDAMKEKKYTEARRLLLQWQDQFPNNEELEPIRKELQRHAGELLKQAQELIATNPEQARNKLIAVQEIDPQLPGLRDAKLQLDKQFPILTIGVRNLPVNLSPALAVTDVEKQSLDLVFESLLKLAGDLPDVVPLGRHFQLPRDAMWDNGQAPQPVRAGDVRKTVELMSDPQWKGRDVEWAKLMARPHITDDALQITLNLRHGYLDPLALMDFKVLPESLNSIDNVDFARHPVGSGPFHFVGVKNGDPGFSDKAVFAANQYYGARSGRNDLPLIREIHMAKVEDPAREFRDGKLLLLWDPPSAKFKELLGAKLDDVVKFRTLPNRRIYFLALNHRNSVFQNEAFRRGLAHAIKREDILDACFREGLKGPPHRALNGPYPPGSWGCKPDMQPYNQEIAKAQMENAKANRPAKLTLTLKYPDDDPAVFEACKMIKKQIEGVDPSLTIELVARTPEQLHREVEIDHDYQLAYYSHDFANDSYWLWPLFHQKEEGAAENFLGYKNDSKLEQLLRTLMGHRNVAVLQGLAQQIHQHCFDKVPFIPLWQLDTHLVIRQNLQIPNLDTLDAQAVFRDVDHWVLGQKPVVGVK